MVLLPEPDTPITTSAHGVRPMSLSTKILRKRCRIHEPNRLAHGMRTVRGQVLAIKHARQDRALVRAGDQEQHFPADKARWVVGVPQAQVETFVPWLQQTLQ